MADNTLRAQALKFARLARVSEPSSQRLEMMAQLIVEECLDVAESMHNDSGDEWDKAMRAVIAGIKERFGVK